MVDHSKLELYNKTQYNQSQGTLVGNWWEEREMRIATNIGRTVQVNHIPKLRSQLFSLPPEEIKLQDNNIEIKTADRIFCDRKYQEFSNTNSIYGNEINKANQFEKLGKKTKQFLHQNLNKIQQEQQYQQQQEKAQQSQRYFETTQQTYHGMKSNTGSIGRIIMKDQNYNEIRQQRYDPFFVETGRIQRLVIIKQRPILSQRINIDQDKNYVDHVQATYYEEKKNLGNFYKSNGDNFKLNNSFVKTFSHYSHQKL